MAHEGGMWKQVGRWYVPTVASITEHGSWFGYGKLLGLALLAVRNINPISPVLLYVLLLKMGGATDMRSVMNLSLEFIKEVDEHRAEAILPWMIVPPCQSWVQLPNPHRERVVLMIDNLGIQVRSSSCLCENS